MPEICGNKAQDPGVFPPLLKNRIINIMLPDILINKCFQAAEK